MADSPNHEVPLRRRREGRTNYEKRLALLKSGDHRAVIRISNNHTEIQFAAYHPDGDRIVTTATSRHLQEHGWDEHTGNLPAAYVTGFLAGKKALDEGVNKAVPDFGVQDQEYGSRHYAAVKGMRDAGLDVPADESVLPADERAHGSHASSYESSGIDETVDDVKDDIADSYGA